MKQNKIIEALKALLFVCFFVGLLCGSQAQADPLGKDMAEVIGKTPNSIVIASHQFKMTSNHVIVTSLSSIIDIDGKRITLNALKIPCVAKISLYQSKKSPDPELVKLEVKEYGNNASGRYTRKTPFKRYPE